MSTQRLDVVAIGWKQPYKDGDVYNKLVSSQGDSAEREDEFYTKFVEGNRFDYYHVAKNDLNKVYCFYDGRDGRFLIWGMVLAAKCDYDDDCGDFEPKAWSEEELASKRAILHKFRDNMPECLRPEIDPQLITFTQLH